ncbi:hypothetical protein NHQ30_009427 [Ciborinia camelliae]|nr:hypothetical protein NHQ30_009427 [Ciborinia camelliae]
MHSTLVFLVLAPLLFPTLILAAPTPSLFQLLDSIINTTITASTLNSPPPQALMTTVHSEECVDVNQGALMCCPAIFDGDQPVVVEAAQMFHLVLNPNSINGIGCLRNYNPSPIFLSFAAAIGKAKVCLRRPGLGLNAARRSWASQGATRFASFASLYDCEDEDDEAVSKTRADEFLMLAVEN